MAKGALKFKNMTVAKQPQELGRLRVLGGPDAGALFVITSPKVSIGRGEENEIVIVDLKMSRRHAEIMQTPQGLLIKDLGSSNGIAINGQVLKQWYLKSGDKIGIGSTVLEFVSGDAGTQMLTVPPPSVAKDVGAGAASGLTQFLKLVPPAGSGGATTGPQQSWIEKNKKLAISLGVLLVLCIALPEAEFQVKKRRRAYTAPVELQATANNLRSFLPQGGGDDDTKKKADVYFKEGYREFMEKNYLRAKSNFEVALQIYPAHEMARIYSDNTTKAMEEEAKTLKEQAKKDEEAHRYTSALHRYDAIRRMYFKDQSNAIYKEADQAYIALEKKMKEAR